MSGPRSPDPSSSETPPSRVPYALPGKAPTLRDRKRAAAKARVVDVAFALFAERGYANVSVDEICAAADVAPRSFFRYFPAKEGVLFEPVREMSDAFEAAIVDAPSELDDDAVLRLGLARLAAYYLAHEERLAGVFRVAAQTPAFHSAPSAHLTTGERRVVEHLLRRGADDSPGDWRTRLRVARAVAGFRVWLDDVRTRRVVDPLGHLEEILDEA
jgi:AcrR family transcriptional regulator